MKYRIVDTYYQKKHSDSHFLVAEGTDKRALIAEARRLYKLVRGARMLRVEGRKSARDYWQLIELLPAGNAQPVKLTAPVDWTEGAFGLPDPEGLSKGSM